MAGESDRPNRVATNTVCPLQCRLRSGPGGRASAPGHVDWAGLPVNLDFAFSPAQRDKVYVQHLMRKREAQLWRLQNGAQACDCEIAAERGHLDPHADQAHIESLSAGKH
jgi:hypothetical protein